MDSKKQEQNLAIREVADCTACGRVTGWHESKEEALAEMESLEAA